MDSSSSTASSPYGAYPKRRHIFSWIVLGLLGLLVVGTLALWGFALITGHAPPFFARPVGFFLLFPFGFLIFILIIFIALRLAFLGSRRGWRGGDRRGYYYGADAKEILRIRYARGEITKEQLDQMMKDLDEHK